MQKSYVLEFQYVAKKGEARMSIWLECINMICKHYSFIPVYLFFLYNVDFQIFPKQTYIYSVLQFFLNRQ